MRDLEIWRHLANGTVDASELLAVMRWPIQRRGPYLGYIAALTAHTDEHIRGFAIAALGGCRGVPGVRAIVQALDDDSDIVRNVAVAALRETAREAPYRYAHALFHHRVEIRLEALQLQPTSAASELGVYLRADPACSEAARSSPWPTSPGAIGLLLDLHRDGFVPAAELVTVLGTFASTDIRVFLARERQRVTNTVDAYLADGNLIAAPGGDHLDTIIAAIAGAAADDTALRFSLDRFVQMIGPTKHRALALRTVISILDWIARHPEASPETRRSLLAVAIAFEPMVLEIAEVRDDITRAGAYGLVRYHWPCRPNPAEAQRLLERFDYDLALAAALAGLLQTKRLEHLEAAFGETALIDALVASNHGWAEVCALPGETPALEIGWLAAVEQRDYKRYIELAGRAVATYNGKRLDAFVEQIPRRHRVAAYLAAVRAPADLATVCKAIANRIDRAGVTTMIEALLGEPALLRALIHEIGDKLLTSGVIPLSDAQAIVLVDALSDPEEPPARSRELAIADAFSTRDAPALRAWATRIGIVDRPVIAPEPQSQRPQRALTSEERAEIMSASPADLSRALIPAFAGPVTGLTSALAVIGATPSPTACAALMGCADPIEDVARQLERFAHGVVDAMLDREMNRWHHVGHVVPLVNAYLYRWEKHTLALARYITVSSGAHELLRFVDTLGDGLAGRTLWQGISEALMFLRYRDVPRFKEHATEGLAMFCAERVDRPIGRHAARIVVACVEAKVVDVGAVRERVLDRIADADAATREFAARLVRLDGMPAPPPPMPAPVSADLVSTIRKTSDLDALVGWCRHGQAAIVEEAVLAILVLGARGEQQLAALLDRLHDLANPLPILASVQLWEDADAIARARDLAAQPSLPAPWRFYLNLALRDIEAALAAVREPSSEWSFRRDDWDALLRVTDIATCSIALADSPHHHAYQRAVAYLLSTASEYGRTLEPLARFLEVDGDRPLALRRDAAQRLMSCGDDRGMPILVEALFDPSATVITTDDMLEHLVAASLIGGPSVVHEKRMWDLVEASRKTTSPEARNRIYERILDQATTATPRRGAAMYAVSQGLAFSRLQRVANVFAWGVRRGVELTGRFFTFHLTAKESDFGHTRIRGSQIFVSPLPMLRDEENGQDIVEGLVLHEIGHHVYHRGETSEAIWNKAHKEGIGHLLNLVADEHLERNLRAINPEYGDRLKRLGAYAFQHALQEIAVPVLLDSLRGSAAPALINAELGVGFAENSVRLRRGHILGELDRAGHPLARFARAYRLGFGNRSGDPRITEAISLTQGIRDMSMQQLYELTVKLAHLFGGATEVAHVFGGSEGLEAGDHERDDDVFGAGVSDDALQKEIQRVLDPRTAKQDKEKGGDRLWINVAAENDFDRITSVERVHGSPEAHRALVADVERHAARLRSYLDELGLRWLPQRARTQGRALDRTRLLPLVTRNDPRILIARTPTRRTDLFLGVLVDCSGSMAAKDNIGRAKRFAALVAEAVDPLPGVEARFYGFTDSKIYDCGTARNCGVSGLVTSGGNNDAAGLFHAATEALASQKRAKVLVMISDGLPTQCSVDALRALVAQLTRRKGIVCAQVAVHPLEEVCFPNHVLLDGSIEAAVARFGRMIGDLARKSMGL